MTSSTQSTIPIACNLGALNADERAQREALAARLWANRQAVVETETGYAIRLTDDPSAHCDAFALSQLERRCCPFLRIDMTMEANAGPTWLTLSGGPGVKAFLSASSLMGEQGCDPTNLDPVA